MKLFHLPNKLGYPHMRRAMRVHTQVKPEASAFFSCFSTLGLDSISKDLAFTLV